MVFSAQELNQHICVLEPLLFYLGLRQNGKLLFKKQTLLGNSIFESFYTFTHFIPVLQYK